MRNLLLYFSTHQLNKTCSNYGDTAGFSYLSSGQLFPSLSRRHSHEIGIRLMQFLARERKVFFLFYKQLFDSVLWSTQMFLLFEHYFDS